MSKAKHHINQHGDLTKIGNIPWESLKEKWKDFEGKPLEKSINKPIFLTSTIKEKYRHKEERGDI